MNKDIQKEYSIAVNVTREAIEKKRQLLESNGYNSAAIINEAGNHGATFTDYVRNAISYNGLLNIFNYLDGFDQAIRYANEYKNQGQQEPF